MKTLITLTMFFVLALPTYAQTLKNSDIQLELNPPQEKTIYDINPLLNDQKKSNISENLIKEENYHMYLSYWSDNKKLPLGIKLSTSRLNFGELTSGEPIIRDLEIGIFSGSSRGYSVHTGANHLLASVDNVRIPNTSCDSGACTASVSDTWALPLTYGLGYTCHNREDAACLLASGSYRRFAVLEENENMQPVLQGTTNSLSNIQVKINIPSTQLPGSYQNTIYYLLTPHF